MNARAARRASNEQAGASLHSHAYPPSREELQRQVGRQQREIEKLRDQVAERDQRIADAEKQVADAEKQVADAEKQIADLDRQRATRKKNSPNSSRPPSSAGLAGAQRRRCSPRKKSGRKPGGQPGHMGQERQCGEAGSDRGGLAVAMQALRNRIATSPGGAADGRGCLLPSDRRLAGSDPARGHGIPVSKTGVSLLPEGDARRVTFRTRTRDRGTADGGGQLSDLRAEDDAARRARHVAGPVRRGYQRGQRAESVGGDRRCGGSALHGIGRGSGYRAGVKQRRNR